MGNLLTRLMSFVGNRTPSPGVPELPQNENAFDQKKSSRFCNNDNELGSETLPLSDLVAAKSSMLFDKDKADKAVAHSSKQELGNKDDEPSISKKVFGCAPASIDLLNACVESLHDKNNAESKNSFTNLANKADEGEEEPANIVDESDVSFFINAVFNQYYNQENQNDFPLPSKGVKNENPRDAFSYSNCVRADPCCSTLCQRIFEYQMLPNLNGAVSDQEKDQSAKNLLCTFFDSQNRALFSFDGEALTKQDEEEDESLEEKAAPSSSESSFNVFDNGSEKTATSCTSVGEELIESQAKAENGVNQNRIGQTSNSNKDDGIEQGSSSNVANTSTHQGEPDMEAAWSRAVAATSTSTHHGEQNYFDNLIQFLVTQEPGRTLFYDDLVNIFSHGKPDEPNSEEDESESISSVKDDTSCTSLGQQYIEQFVRVQGGTPIDDESEQSKLPSHTEQEETEFSKSSDLDESSIVTSEPSLTEDDEINPQAQTASSGDKNVKFDEVSIESSSEDNAEISSTTDTSCSSVGQMLLESTLAGNGFAGNAVDDSSDSDSNSGKQSDSSDTSSLQSNSSCTSWGQRIIDSLLNIEDDENDSIPAISSSSSESISSDDEESANVIMEQNIIDFADQYEQDTIENLDSDEVDYMPNPDECNEDSFCLKADTDDHTKIMNVMTNACFVTTPQIDLEGLAPLNTELPSLKDKPKDECVMDKVVMALKGKCLKEAGESVATQTPTQKDQDLQEEKERELLTNVELIERFFSPENLMNHIDPNASITRYNVKNEGTPVITCWKDDEPPKCISIFDQFYHSPKADKGEFLSKEEEAVPKPSSSSSSTPRSNRSNRSKARKNDVNNEEDGGQEYVTLEDKSVEANFPFDEEED